MTQVQKVIDNVTYTTSYTYNLANQIVTMTYPSGRVVKNYYDAIGRATGVQNNSNSAYYASSIGYDTANDVIGFTYGNGVVASYGFTAQRLLLSSISYTEGSTTLLGLSYGYTQSGGNDAEITSITDSTASGRSASYTYNADGALTAASTTGSTGYPAWGLSWTYDRYGNRTAQIVTAGSAYSSSPTVSTSTNHISSVGGHSYTYDASGNLTQDDLFKYKLDGENRMVEVDYISGTPLAYYSYDGKSNRTVKVVDGGRTFYLYGAGSKVISVFDDAASNTYTSGTTPGSAVDDYYATLLYQHKDQLTTRLTTDNSGVLASYQGHFPFGETWYEGGTADPSLQQRFATFMKDYETDTAMLHYAMSQFYSARNGELQTLAPGRPGITQPVNPYADQNPVGSSPGTGGSTGPSNNPNQFAIMTDGGGPEAGACLDPTDPASCGGLGFGNQPILGNSNQFAAITNAFDAYLKSIDTNDATYLEPMTPDEFTQQANAIMALMDPSSFLNNISYLPVTPPEKKGALLAWETPLFQKFPQGPLNPSSPTSSTATCNLQLQQGTNCSYSCASQKLFGPFSTMLTTIESACSLSSTTTQCPSQIQVKGLDLSTAKVSLCTMP